MTEHHTTKAIAIWQPNIFQRSPFPCNMAKHSPECLPIIKLLSNGNLGNVCSGISDGPLNAYEA